MTTSTNMDKLKKALSDSFSIQGIPEAITHDNGPPYNDRSHDLMLSPKKV